MTITTDFEKWALGFSGCDGGDIGSHEKQSIWYCGIEWGGGWHEKMLEDEDFFVDGTESPPCGYAKWQENISYRFNWQAMKLLGVIHGKYKPDDYQKFTEEVKPFVKGETGYFKMNLYPLSFKNTDQNQWSSGFQENTGFSKKQDYIDWVRDNRFFVMRNWAQEFKPKLIICTGKTYRNDFMSAFGDDGMKISNKQIDEHTCIYYGENSDGALIVVLPFSSGKWGLIRDNSIQLVGDFIRNELAKK